MSGAAELLATLEAAGVMVSLNALGDGLKLSAATPPPAELLAQIRAAKPALLEVLRGVPSGQTLSTAGTLTHTCGTCARWEALAPPLAHMGLCSAGRAAHGWHDGNPAAHVEIHAAHSCTAWEGQGFRARAGGRRYGPRPPVEPGVSL